jgi:hypothetical protein
VPGLDCSESGHGHMAGCYEHGNVPSGSKRWTSRGTVSFSRRTLLHGVTGIWDRHVNLQTQLTINHQWPITAQKGKFSQIGSFRPQIRNTNRPITRRHKPDTLPLLLAAVKRSNLTNIFFTKKKTKNRATTDT